MKCSQIKRKLTAFLDGETSEEESQLISEHVKSCEHCRKELEELSQVSDVLNTMDEVRVSPFFITRLKQRIADQKSKRVVRMPFVEWIRRATLPTFATALVFLSFLVGSNLAKTMYQKQVESIAKSDTEIVDVLDFSTLDELPESSLGWAYNSLLIGGE
jgi:predicted anti-sigma-YlaC factor YlaD